MSLNQQRMAEKAGNKMKVTPSGGKSSQGGGKGIFSTLERQIKLERFFEDGFPVHYLPKVAFVMLISILYISNTHYAEKTIRRINAIQAEVEDLRADYTTLKSDLMFASKQSEVARKVRELGLTESRTPPHKVKVE